MSYQSTFLTSFGNGEPELCLVPAAEPVPEEPKPRKRSPYFDATVPIFKYVREHLDRKWNGGATVLWSPARVVWPEAPDHIVVFVDEAPDLYSKYRRSLEALYNLLDDRRFGYDRAKHGIMCDGERKFQNALKEADVPLHVLGKERWNVTVEPVLQSSLDGMKGEGLQRLYASYEERLQLFMAAMQDREKIKKFRYTPKRRLPEWQSRLVPEPVQKRVDETPRHIRRNRQSGRLLSRNDLLLQAGNRTVVAENKPSSEFFQTYLGRRRRQLHIYHCEHFLRGDTTSPLLCIYPVIPSRAELGGLGDLSESVSRPVGSVTVANRHCFGRSVKNALEEVKGFPDSDGRELELDMLDFYAKLAH